MSRSDVIASIEKELAGFQPDEQEKLGQEIASYLRKVRTLRHALSVGEADMAQGRVKSLADLDETIAALRRRYAG